MKHIKTYSEMNEEISLRKAVVGGAIGAASLFSNPAVSQSLEKPIVATNFEKEESVYNFARHLETQIPEAVAKPGEPADMDTTLPVSLLENRFRTYAELKPHLGLELKDLNMLSKKDSPLKITYFYLRGLDDNQRGPKLMPILNFSYTTAVSLYGHDIRFNLTRITGVTTLGATIDF